MAYVYRHIREDKNEPFYIGIGNDNKYSRARSVVGRNVYWNNIVNKTNFHVEIMIDNLSWGDACKKEIEFIDLYKRRNDGGILCNMTKGGDGKLGVKPTNAFPKGHIPYSKGKPMPKHQLDNLIKINTGRPSPQKGIPISREAVEKAKRTKEINGTVLKGDRHGMFGKTHSDELRERWSRDRKGIPPPNKGKKMPNGATPKMRDYYDSKSKAVEKYSMNNEFIESYKSINEAAIKTGISKGNISLCCRGNRLSVGGFKWKLK